METLNRNFEKKYSEDIKPFDNSMNESKKINLEFKRLNDEYQELKSLNEKKISELKQKKKILKILR